MSRSGYSDDYCGDSYWPTICYRGAVTSAIRGKRGQAFLTELRDALDAMPVKRLVALELEKGGEVCALGAIAKARGLSVEKLDPEDYHTVAGTFGIAEALAREIVFENDEGVWFHKSTPENRWQHMRNWVERHLVKQVSP
ncbi:hypothetical protein AB4037_23235 [Labrys sp. KB_33_2]|uniref:hypothetical protein n=1 Tax=Labrys sp. KB_33_2 TaxID=3237479 RepID=UPI003F8FA3AB